MERGFSRIVLSKKAINLHNVKSRNFDPSLFTSCHDLRHPHDRLQRARMKSAVSHTARRLRTTPATAFRLEAKFLSTSAARGAKAEGKAPPPPPDEPDTTVAGRSPFAAFVEVLRDEVRKSREFNESVKQLAGERDKVVDSEAMKRAREVYERARVNSHFSSPSAYSLLALSYWHGHCATHSSNHPSDSRSLRTKTDRFSLISSSRRPSRRILD